MKKIFTPKVSKKTFFLLSYPTYADSQEREEQTRSLRNAAQMFQLDLRIIEAEIEAIEDEINTLISMREEDWKQDVDALRSQISELRDEFLAKESEGTEYVEDFRLEWVCRHLQGWNYANGKGDIVKSNDDTLSIPAHVEELKDLELDKRIIDRMIEEVHKFYDGEEEKNG